MDRPPSQFRLIAWFLSLIAFSFTTVTFAQNTDALAAYSFDAGSGTTLADVSGHGNAMSLLNGPSWTGGRYGSALSFDGTNDMTVTNTYNAALNLTGKNFTLSAWIYPRSNSGWQMIVNKPYTSSHSAPYFDWSMHRETSTGRISAWIGCDGQQRLSNSSTPLNTWTHVVVTYDGSALRHYINGVLDRSSAVSCAVTNSYSRSVRIGANASGGEVMNGLIDDVRIYNRPLSAAEIQRDMATPLSNSTSSSDTSAPSISITSPTYGSSVNGTLAVSANASDNVGIAGVQFKLDGAALGAEVQNSPYSVQWNTTQTANGTHTITAAARDAQNNSTTSSAVSVVVDNSPGTPAPTLTLSANPGTVTSGSSASLTWSGTDATSCTASGAWSGTRATSGTADTGPLTTTSTFTLTCNGSGGSTSKSVTVTVNGSTNQSGLDFQGNASTTGTVRFHFSNPLSMYPATYVWRFYPRQQSGYYTTFFWGNNGSFDVYNYYGAHPYPNPAPSGSEHRWEIAVGGGDYQSSEKVVYGVWYTQALRVWADASGKHHEFYWDLPDTTKVIRVSQTPSYGSSGPASPALIFGDAPWNASNEIMNGIIRGIQIYNATLSLTDISAEISSPRSTSTGASSLWYLNLDPTPADITDKSGAGHHPQWVGTERPKLWNGP